MSFYFFIKLTLSFIIYIQKKHTLSIQKICIGIYESKFKNLIKKKFYYLLILFLTINFIKKIKSNFCLPLKLTLLRHKSIKSKYEAYLWLHDNLNSDNLLKS